MNGGSATLLRTHRNKRYRDNIAQAAFSAGVDRRMDKLLVPVVIYSDILDFTEVPEGAFPWGVEPLMDACTDRELQVKFGDQMLSLSLLHEQKHLVPTQLLLLSEAITTKVDFEHGVGQLSLSLQQNVLLTTADSFWELVSSEEEQDTLLAKHPKVHAMLLPGLATAPDPEDPMIMQLLSRMAQRMDARCLPQIQEYGAINYKPVQFQIAEHAGVAGGLT